MSRYTPREKADCPKLQSAINHSKKHGGRRQRISTTDVGNDPESKRKFDENYEAIFGKKEIPHGTD